LRLESQTRFFSFPSPQWRSCLCSFMSLRARSMRP
jgi:hypothetical protein